MIKEKINNLFDVINRFVTDINKSNISEFLDWFVDTINLHFHKKTPNLKPNKWDIYFVNLWKNIGSELNKSRPCIIYSNYFFNSWDTILVLPLKSYKGKVHRNLNFLLKTDPLNWLFKNSLVDLMWIRQISKKRIGKFIWKVKPDFLVKIDKKMLKIFNIKKIET